MSEATSENDQSPVDGTVEVRVPAKLVFVATLRLVAASLAARCELTVDDIEDLRLAVDEACALLMPLAAEDSTIDASFELSPGCLAVTAAVSTRASDPSFDRSGFAWTVLTALASEVGTEAGGQRASITVTKRREAATR